VLSNVFKIIDVPVKQVTIYIPTGLELNIIIYKYGIIHLYVLAFFGHHWAGSQQRKRQ
jgi:hypothetical protein